jgi:hypothetical protein
VPILLLGIALYILVLGFGPVAEHIIPTGNLEVY